jgi:sulfur carrier protein
MTVIVNGDRRDLRSDATVADVVVDLGADPGGCAVAVNDEVVPRSSWAGRSLRAGDRVEVLTAVQGG